MTTRNQIIKAYSQFVKALVKAGVEESAINCSIHRLDVSIFTENAKLTKAGKRSYLHEKVNLIDFKDKPDATEDEKFATSDLDLFTNNL